MLNKTDIGERIANLRRKLKLTQETLVEQVGEEYISLSTLKRIESGKGRLDLLRLKRICDVLKCSITDLIEDNELREYLRICFPDEEGEESEKNIRATLEEQIVFYPKVSDNSLLSTMPILTLLQFVIYLPLIPEHILYDSLKAFSGQAFGYEFYVAKQLRRLYKSIPDSDAKRYADCEAKRCTYEYLVHYYQTCLPDAVLEFPGELPFEEEEKLYDEYQKMLEIKHKFKHALADYIRLSKPNS